METLDTVIFPEGGGQPADRGTLHVVDPDGERRSFVIEGSVRRKLEAVHLVRVEEKDQHVIRALEDQEVELQVDWERREDHVSYE